MILYSLCYQVWKNFKYSREHCKRYRNVAQERCSNGTMGSLKRTLGKKTGMTGLVKLFLGLDH